MYLKFDEILDEMSDQDKIQKHPDKVELFLECVMDELCDLSKDIYEKMTLKFCKLMCDHGFTEQLALYAVAHMENADPKHPKGEYWTMRETNDIAKLHTIPANQLVDFYFVLNMMRSDYFNADLPEDEVCYYAVLAKEWLIDKDVPDSINKSFNYWYHIVKGY